MTGCNRQVYVHIVWSTRGRRPTLELRQERAVYRVMRAEAVKLGCRIIAVNGTEDHLHVLVQMAATVTLARLINQLKGVTSYFVNENRSDDSEIFRWQDGYGAFSVGTNQIQRVTEYIVNQKRHHLTGAVFKQWEPSVEDQPTTDRAPL